MENYTTATVVQVFTGRHSFGALWLKTTVVPVYLHFGHRYLGQVRPSREGVLHHLRGRCAIGKKHGRRSLYFRGISQIQSFKHRMKDVACHIAQGTGTKIPPATPVPRVVNLVKWTFIGRPDKEVPIEGLRYSMSFFRNHKSLRPDGAVSKRFYLGHLSNLTVRDPVDYLANARAG